MQCRQNNGGSNDSRVPEPNHNLHAAAAAPPSHFPHAAHLQMRHESSAPSKSSGTATAAEVAVQAVEAGESGAGHLGKSACLRLEKCAVPRLRMKVRHLRIVKIGSHVFWLVFCILGLAYHLETVCDGYFRYATTTDTVIDIASRFRPPALTVCFDSTSIRRKTPLPHGANMFEADPHDCPPPSPRQRQQQQRRRQESGSKEGDDDEFNQKEYETRGGIRDACHFPVNSMSLKEIANLTYDFVDLIQQIWYRDPDSYASILLNQSHDSEEFEFYIKRHVRTRFKGRMKCFIDRPIPVHSKVEEESSSSDAASTPVNAEQFNASIIHNEESSNRKSITTGGTVDPNNSPSIQSSSYGSQTQGYNTLLIADAETEGMILRLYFKQMTGSPYRYEREWERRNHPVPDIVKVFIHESDREPRGYLSPALVFNLTQYRTIIVSYQKVINILLPPPFPSACRVYADVSHIELENSYSNQKDCMESCLDLEPGDGQLSPETVHRMDEEKFLRESDSLKLRSSCVRSCPLPCTRTEYFARLGSQKESGDGTIALGPGDAEIVVTFKARTEPFEFVIFIAGCFNLWFGVAVYGSTIDICRDMARNFLVPHSGSGSRSNSGRSRRQSGKSNIRTDDEKTQRQRRPSHGSDRKRIPASVAVAEKGREQNTEQCTDVPHRREGDAGYTTTNKNQNKKKGSKISFISSSRSLISLEEGMAGTRIPEGRTTTMTTYGNDEDESRPAAANSFLFSSFFSPAGKKITDLAGRFYQSLLRIVTVRQL